MSGELHGSIVALQGYCYFHRMLIAIVEEYPDMKEVINQKVRDFISNEFYRHKRVSSFRMNLNIRLILFSNVLQLVTFCHY